MPWINANQIVKADKQKKKNMDFELKWVKACNVQIRKKEREKK